jgi:hypothetical protein
MINSFLFLWIWPKLLSDTLVGLSRQIKVFLLKWIGSLKHAFKRVVILDLSHYHWIHKLDDSILVLLLSLFKSFSLFRCEVTGFLLLFYLLNALMNIEQVCGLIACLMAWNSVCILVHVKDMLEKFGICGLIFCTCHILIEAHLMLRINIISFNVVVHLVLIKNSVRPRL